VKHRANERGRLAVDHQTEIGQELSVANGRYYEMGQNVKRSSRHKRRR